MVEKLLSGFQSEQKKERRKGEAMRVGEGHQNKAIKGSLKRISVVLVFLSVNGITLLQRFCKEQ